MKLSHHSSVTQIKVDLNMTVLNAAGNGTAVFVGLALPLGTVESVVSQLKVLPGPLKMMKGIFSNHRSHGSLKFSRVSAVT